MGMYVSAMHSIGVRTFNGLCEDLGLPEPRIDEKVYCAVVDEELYKIYQETHQGLMDIIMSKKGRIGLTEYRFMRAFEILSDRRLELSADYEWCDICFE